MPQARKPKKEEKMSPAAERNDPYRKNHFLVEIDGMASASFLSVYGIESITEVIEYRNGNEDAVPRRLPGLHKCTDITLRRGLTDNRDLWNWYLTVLEGRTERRNGVIVVLDQSRRPVLRLSFREAWPCRWSLSGMDALAKETIIEEVELVVEDLRLDAG
jgi:phage tail-like protein